MNTQNIQELSKYFKKDLKEYYNFKGNYVKVWGWLLWLLNTIEGSVICVWKNKQHKYPITYDIKTSLFVVENWVIDEISRCSEMDNVRFIIGICVIYIKPGKSHANALIFDKENKVLTRYEPRGARTRVYDNSKLDNVIRNWLKQIYGDKWKYNGPIDYCPNIGPQKKETSVKNNDNVDFCTIWSLLYIHFRIMNPKMSDKQISDYLESKTDQELHSMIRQYTEFIQTTIDPDWVLNALIEDDTYKMGDYIEIYFTTKQMKYKGRVLKMFPTFVAIFIYNDIDKNFKILKLRKDHFIPYASKITDKEQQQKIDKMLTEFLSSSKQTDIDFLLHHKQQLNIAFPNLMDQINNKSITPIIK